MGKDNKNLNRWLEQSALPAARLVEFLEVETGWETAVETVLGSYLEAVCLDDMNAILPCVSSLQDESLTVFVKRDALLGDTKPTLLNKVRAAWDLSSLLSGIYCADSLDAAQQLLTQLQVHESVITPDGIWLSHSWLKIQRTKDHKTGVLQREKQLRLFKQQQEQLHEQSDALEQQLGDTEAELKTAEQNREHYAQQNR